MGGSCGSHAPMDEDGTPYGMGGDHCPYCGRDWKQPHDPECPRFRPCQYPPGCPAEAAPGKRLCNPHYDAVYALFGPPKEDS